MLEGVVARGAVVVADRTFGGRPCRPAALVVGQALLGGPLAQRIEDAAKEEAGDRRPGDEHPIHSTQRTGRAPIERASWCSVPDHTIQLTTHDGTMPCYEAAPETGAVRGAVLVAQEAFGVNGHIEDVTRRFAAAGYHAVAPHLFHRTGDPVLGYDDLGLVMPHIQALSDQTLLEDVGATLDHLHGIGFVGRQIGAVGFCMGGRVTFLVAGTLALGAAVGFYGGGIVTGRSETMGSLLGLIPSMATPWLGLFGDDDQSIPVADVEQLADELRSAAPVDTEVVRYPGAGHGFHCDARSSYSEVAALDAWNRTLVWFDDHLEKVER